MMWFVVGNLVVVVILFAICPTAGSGCIEKTQVSAEMDEWTDVPQDNTLLVRWSLANVSLLCFSEYEMIDQPRHVHCRSLHVDISLF